MFMTLCDGDTKKDSSSKRIEKSSSRSQIMTARCAERWQQNERMRSSAMLIPLQGGAEPTVRRSFAASMAQYGVMGAAGVVVDGLGQQGEEVASRNVNDFEECIRASLVSAKSNFTSPRYYLSFSSQIHTHFSRVFVPCMINTNLSDVTPQTSSKIPHVGR